MPIKNIQPGDVTLSKIELHSLNGDRCANITDQVKTIDIFESILSPSVYCEILVLDSIDLLTKFPIIGEEYIDIEFKTESMNTSTKYRFFVYSVSDNNPSKNEKYKTYVLKLISEEVFKSAGKLITKKYKQESNKIIKDILNQLKTKKEFQYESTMGIEEISIPQLKPFQAIDYIRRRTVSKKYKSSSYVFFENKFGYNLVTLEHLFDTGKAKIGDKIFFYDSNVREDIRTVNIRNIIAYEQLNVVDSIQKIHGGGLNNQVRKFDIITGSNDLISFNNKTDFKTVDKNNADTTNVFQDYYGKDVGRSLLVPYDSARPDSLMPEKVSYLQGYVQKIIQNLLHVHVYGDSGLSVGDIVELRLPDQLGSDASTKADRLYSGNYLVAKLRHMISVGPNSTHTISMQCIKASMLSNQ